MNLSASAVSLRLLEVDAPPRAAQPLPSPLHGRIVQSRFQPHPLLSGAHLQTIAQLLRPQPRLALRRERLELADGDFVDVGWSGDHNARGPLAVLVHGLAGGFESKYLLGTACQLIALGWRTVILQLRGAGAEPNRLDRHYNHDDTEDLRFVWRLLRGREPDAFIASVGWSLGGNVMLKALAEEGAAAPVDVAAAASVPFKIRPCIERLRRGFSRVYQKHLLGFLKATLRAKHARVQSARFNLPAALAARTFFEYDEAYTAPLAGYPDVEDYYTHASCGQFLKGIQRSTLVVHALDDPFMTADIVPAVETLSPHVTLELARSGGHVGFISAGAFGQPYFWLDRRLAGYLHVAFGQKETRPGGWRTGGSITESSSSGTGGSAELVGECRESREEPSHPVWTGSVRYRA